MAGVLTDCHARMLQIQKQWSMQRSSCNEQPWENLQTMHVLGYPRYCETAFFFSQGRATTLSSWKLVGFQNIGTSLSRLSGKTYNMPTLQLISCDRRSFCWLSLLVACFLMFTSYQGVDQVMTIVRSCPPCPGLLLTGLRALNIIKKNESLGKHQLCL